MTKRPTDPVSTKLWVALLVSLVLLAVIGAAIVHKLGIEIPCGRRNGRVKRFLTRMAK